MEDDVIVRVNKRGWCNFNRKVPSSCYFDGKCGLLFNKTHTYRREKSKTDYFINKNGCMHEIHLDSEVKGK